MAKDFNEQLEVALSGGGFRATAFGLGVLLYLVHSGLNRNVATISSVSGGSITNGFVANQCDFGTVDINAFRQVAARLAGIVKGKGKWSGFWLASRPYLAFMFFTGAAWLFWALSVFNSWVAGLRGVELPPFWNGDWQSVAGAGVIWGVLGLMRENILLMWISSTFFDGQPLTLASIKDRKVDHVFCATDLTNSGPLFFSTKGGGRIFSEEYGRGEGGNLPLKRVVAASAAFPPAFPPLRIELMNRQFTEATPAYIYLTDGGVWNNLATDWCRLRKKLFESEKEWSERSAGPGPAAVVETTQNRPAGGVLIIANASKPTRAANLFVLKIPLVSFLVALIRVLDTAVNSTVAGRSADVERTTRLRMLHDPDRWDLDAVKRPNGTVSGEGPGTDFPVAVKVEMTRLPGQTASEYKKAGGLKHWEEKPDVYQANLDAWRTKPAEDLLNDERVIPTTLDNLGQQATLRMILLGYLNTRETIAVAFVNHQPPPIPDLAWFWELVGP